MKIRKPKVRITSKGIKVSKPSARIGKRAGINISSKGVSASLRTKRGTISTRKSKSTFGKNKGCSKLLSTFILVVALLIIMLTKLGRS